MTHDEATVLVLKGMISELTPQDQEKVTALAETFRQALTTEGTCAVIAFALVGAEMSTKTGA